jgi:tellurite resistance protein TehA-like permease
MLSQLMSEFGCALYGFLFGTALLALEANRSVPVRLDEPLFIIFLAIFLVYTIVWTIRLVVRLRPPGQT